MAKIVIKNQPGLDGSYDLELGTWDFDEFRIIKKEAGVRAGEIEEAMRAGDSNLIVAYAIIALKRAGRDVVPERLWKANIEDIEFDTTDEPEFEETPLVNGSGESTSEPSESS